MVKSKVRAHPRNNQPERQPLKELQQDQIPNDPNQKGLGHKKSGTTKEPQNIETEALSNIPLIWNNATETQAQSLIDNIPIQSKIHKEEPGSLKDHPLMLTNLWNKRLSQKKTEALMGLEVLMIEVSTTTALPVNNAQNHSGLSNQDTIEV